jgi:hypothetical protein
VDVLVAVHGAVGKSDNRETRGQHKALCDPVTATSTPHSSMRKSIDPMDDNHPRTTSQVPAASRALRTAAMSDFTRCGFVVRGQNDFDGVVLSAFRMASYQWQAIRDPWGFNDMNIQPVALAHIDPAV